MKNKLTFNVKENDTNVVYAVVKPSPSDLTEAQKVYNRAFRDALESGAILREKLNDVLKSQGLWDDEKQKKYDDLNRQFREKEIALARGKMHKDDGKKIALEMRKLREDMRDMQADRNTLDSHTAQAQADNVRFNYLVSVCSVYNDTGKKVFNSLKEYLSRATDDLSFTCASNFAILYHGLDNDYEKNLPENKFLLKFKYVDDKLRLVDGQGQLIDEEGRQIDENGRFINALGQYVDRYGNRVDEAGNFIVEDAGDFFDDSGEAVN